MRKLIGIVVLAAVCCGVLTSCNEKPRNYKFVRVLADGQEQVEKITAKNDTDALKLYLDALEKNILQSLDHKGPEYKMMYIISPEGDTLNTDQELTEAVMGSQDRMIVPPPSQTVPTH